jgi:YD repeat-containing protein
MPLNFSYTYSSHETQLPSPLHPITPMGVGWTHSYLSYIIKEEGWTESNLGIEDFWMVHWESGDRNFYDCKTQESISEGVYDDFILKNNGTIVITTIDQIEHTFMPYTLDSGLDVFLLEEVRDRNDNIIQIVIDPALLRIDKVIGTAERIIDFDYDSNGMLTEVEDVSGGRTIYFTYDSADNLSSYINAKNNITSYAYASLDDPDSDIADHLLYEVIRPEGNVIKNGYQNGFLSSNQIGASAPSTMSVQPGYDDETSMYSSHMVDEEGRDVISHYNPAGYISDTNIENKITFWG